MEYLNEVINETYEFLLKDTRMLPILINSWINSIPKVPPLGIANSFSRIINSWKLTDWTSFEALYGKYFSELLIFAEKEG